jgi:hypothetical protein
MIKHERVVFIILMIFGKKPCIIEQGTAVSGLINSVFAKIRTVLAFFLPCVWLYRPLIPQYGEREGENAAPRKRDPPARYIEVPRGQGFAVPPPKDLSRQ